MNIFISFQNNKKKGLIFHSKLFTQNFWNKLPFFFCSWIAVFFSKFKSITQNWFKKSKNLIFVSIIIGAKCLGLFMCIGDGSYSRCINIVGNIFWRTSLASIFCKPFLHNFPAQVLLNLKIAEQKKVIQTVRNWNCQNKNLRKQQHNKDS